MNIKKQNRIETSKRAAALQPGDVFQAINEDTFQYVVMSRDGKYIRFKELRTGLTFTDSHYRIESYTAFKVLGVLKKRPFMRILTLGRVWYKIKG